MSGETGGCIFFFNDTATTEIYTLSLHDALPIFEERVEDRATSGQLDNLREDVAQLDAKVDEAAGATGEAADADSTQQRSEEYTSELQSRQYLVCRLLLEKKKKRNTSTCRQEEIP